MHIRQKGVMTKAVYDPDKDGLIALTELEAAVCSETEADTKIAAHAALFGLHSKIVRKTADQTVNNSDVIQNDDHLLLAIGANEIWYVEFRLKGISAITPDFKFTVVAPAGASGWVWVGTHYGASPVIVSALGIGRTADGKGNDQCYMIGAIVVNSGTAGDIQLQWAQDTADASDTIIYANSLLIAHKLA